MTTTTQRRLAAWVHSYAWSPNLGVRSRPAARSSRHHSSLAALDGGNDTSTALAGDAAYRQSTAERFVQRVSARAVEVVRQRRIEEARKATAIADVPAGPGRSLRPLPPANGSDGGAMLRREGFPATSRPVSTREATPATAGEAKAVVRQRWQLAAEAMLEAEGRNGARPRSVARQWGPATEGAGDAAEPAPLLTPLGSAAAPPLQNGAAAAAAAAAPGVVIRRYASSASASALPAEEVIAIMPPATERGKLAKASSTALAALPVPVTELEPPLPVEALLTTVETAEELDAETKEDAESGTPLRWRDIHVVSDRAEAKWAAAALMATGKDVFHAVDTEVADIDLKKVGPVGNGRVICISIYSGPNVDTGRGKGKVLWVDNAGDAEGVLDEFKAFLESPEHNKVWHNYGFDRHVLYNAPPAAGSYPAAATPDGGDSSGSSVAVSGSSSSLVSYDEGRKVDCLGFAGDTMHMARLWDSSMEKAAGEGGFGLEALTVKLLGADRRKTPMKEIFAEPKRRRDGSEGSLLVLPPMIELQESPKYRRKWIRYSAYDAKATWEVHAALAEKLRAMEWQAADGSKRTMLDFYRAYVVPFGEVLTDMEREGIYVNASGHLREAMVRAQNDLEAARKLFLDWVAKTQPDAAGINPASTTQIQTLLFGGAQRNTKNGKKEQEYLPKEREFKIERDPEELEALGLGENSVPVDAFAPMGISELKAACKERGLKVSGTKAALLARLRGEEQPEVGAELKDMAVADLRDACRSRGLPSEGTKSQLHKRLVTDIKYQLALAQANSGTEVEDAAAAKAKAPSKWRTLLIRSVELTPTKFATSGWPAVSMAVLRELAGRPNENPPVNGRAWEHFGGGKAGHEACLALDALCNMGSIDTMIGTFLLPLQELVDERSRIHCSLNLNTETGRLSSRRPNLQNQPALEKDQYKIRDAFMAGEGNQLIVADYGQLELRLLAHMTNCKSMLHAFEAGGCFHSRTAVGMFDHVRKAVEDGEVLLEWDYSKGKPPKPLVKDVYGAERRKAKTLNFSIAYGKTAHGLAKDWGVSMEEAQGLLEAWYADRPEVKEWQAQVKKEAVKHKRTRTLMGRLRMLPEANSKDASSKGHSLRAAINTPIQGGAADVVMLAMLRISRSETLKRLGWKLLLQVHDEVILEGPEGSADEALAEVVECMEKPYLFDSFGLEKLRVHLAVDAKHAKTWYEAK